MRIVLVAAALSLLAVIPAFATDGPGNPGDDNGRAELSIALVGDREMRPLNAKYRKKRQTTDVLSFFVEDQPRSGAKLLGDVVISVEQARRQAAEGGMTLKSEMVILLIHGILHLLGYDHEKSPRQSQIMFAYERKLHAYLCDRGLLKV